MISNTYKLNYLDSWEEQANMGFSTWPLNQFSLFTGDESNYSEKYIKIQMKIEIQLKINQICN